MNEEHLALCSSAEWAGAVRQDALFTEVHRVLRPGGVLTGQDSLDSPELRELHHDDICVPLVPAGLTARLARAGFTGVAVDTNDYAVRFRATRPRSGHGVTP